MSKKDNVKEWVNHVYDYWLYEFDQESSMRSSSQIIYQQMRDALSLNNFIDAWRALERLKRLSQPGFDAIFESLHKKDQAETRLMCGLGAFYMEDYQQANLFLSEALSLYSSFGHYRGIVLWVQGCVQWLLVSHVDEAILLWEQARSIFLSQREHPNMIPGWYKNRVEEMLLAIEIATKEDCPPHPNRVIKTYSTHASVNIKTAKVFKKYSSFLRTYPILGQIPAGKMYNTSTPEGHLEIHDVYLNNEQYNPVSLKTGENFVSLPQEKEYYYILRVSGNSMNAATPETILDGDYVLMRAQSVANNADIVAAEIVGMDDRATLKRYKTEKGKIILIPESSDPDFQDPISIRREFSTLDDNFHIRGIAIAVLKRVED